MLNFRNTNIALVSLLILLVWLDKLYNVSVWYYLAVFFIYSLVICLLFASMPVAMHLGWVN